MDFISSIKKHTVKLVGNLKSEDELQEVLKRKFTRREYKTFIAFEDGKNIDDIKIILKEEDINEIDKIYKTAIKKLNQEIFKRELVDL